MSSSCQKCIFVGCCAMRMLEAAAAAACPTWPADTAATPNCSPPVHQVFSAKKLLLSESAWRVEKIFIQRRSNPKRSTREKGVEKAWGTKKDSGFTEDMAAAEKFCLRWNDFESNISVAFRELREEKDFFDVTLACEDSQVSAHKVILSACSPFFRNVLRKNPHQHPLLYLKGVKYQEMLSVLNFMYQGEVNVAQDELNSFLAVAEELRVKGLTQGEGTQETAKQRSPPPRDPVPPPKRPRPAPPPPAPARTQQQQQVYRPQEQREEEVQEVQEVQTVKAEPREQQSYQENHESAVALEDGYQEEYGDYAQYEGQYDAIDPNTGLPIADGNKGESLGHSSITLSRHWQQPQSRSLAAKLVCSL